MNNILKPIKNFSHRSFKGFMLLLLFLVISGFHDPTEKSGGEQEEFDVVILNGRVIDPESKYDKVSHVGIKDGKIAVITEKKIKGKNRLGEPIEFFVNPRFYGTEKITADKLMPLMRKAFSVNLVGKKAVDAGIRAGLVNKDDVEYIGEVPHVQVIQMKI